jgi:hypothetical protein
MASGIRVQHPTERNTTFTIVDGRRPYKAPVVCLPCGKTHSFKTYHLALDESGAAIVSREIAEKMKRIPNLGGFSITNEVVDPPPQKLVLSRPMDATRPSVATG